MTRARELAELGSVYDNSALSNRNILMNGAQVISQRGTSALTASSSSDTFITDRFRISNYSDATFTGQQVADARVPLPQYDSPLAVGHIRSPARMRRSMRGGGDAAHHFAADLHLHGVVDTKGAAGHHVAESPAICGDCDDHGVPELCYRRDGYLRPVLFRLAQHGQLGTCAYAGAGR